MPFRRHRSILHPNHPQPTPPQPPSAQALLDRGAPVNGVFRGDAVIHFAASACNVDLLALLIKHGADVNAFDGLGTSCFNLALDAQHRGEVREEDVRGTFRALLAAGEQMVEHVRDALLFRAIGWNDTHLAAAVLDAGGTGARESCA